MIRPGRIDACYARYSSTKQHDGTSIEVQLEACRAAAGGECREYVDEARTGRALAGRTALLRLLDDAERGEIARVFVYKYDRLGRSSETHTIVADLQDLGVDVLSVTEGQDELARGVQLVVAEHYSKALAQRTRDGLVKRFEQRAWTGGVAPYGYQVVTDDSGKRRLAVEPVEAAVVRDLIKMYLTESVGMKELASRLEARAIPTRKGARWSFTTVRGILTNAMLTGVVHYKRRTMKLNRQTGRRVPRANPESEHRTYVDESLRIISQDDFDRVQAKLEHVGGPNKGKRATKSTRALTGLVYCGECGSVCYTLKSKNRKGEYHYLACGHRQRFGSDACHNGKGVREDLIVRDAMTVLASIFDDTDAIIREAAEEARRLMGAKRSDAARLRQQIADIDQQTARVVRLLSDPDLDAMAKRSIARQLSESEARREELQAAWEDAHKDNTADRLVSVIESVLADAKQMFEGATPAQLNQLLEQFMGPVILRPDGKLIQKCQLDSPETDTAPAGAEAVTSNVAGAHFDSTKPLRSVHFQYRQTG